MSLNVFATPTGAETAGITAGPGGALFFADPGGNAIGRITTAGAVTETPLPSPGLLPDRLVADAAGNVDFTEDDFGVDGQLHVGRLSATGKLSKVGLGFSVFEVGGITATPDGDVDVVVADNLGVQVARITPAGAVSFLALPGGFTAGAIAVGPDRNIWITDPDGGGIIRLTGSGVATEFRLPGGQLTGAGGITTGPDGALWFTGSSFIGRITTAGVISEFKLRTVDGRPTAIVAGADGALYLAAGGGPPGVASAGAGIGRITTSGAITYLPIASSGGVAAGSDGNIWITQDGHIAQLVLLRATTTPSPASAAIVRFSNSSAAATPTPTSAVDAAIVALVTDDATTTIPADPTQDPISVSRHGHNRSS